MIHATARLLFLLAACLSISAGCSGLGTSRWAMDNPAYAEKYDAPYTGDDVDKAERMLKQSVDARYVENQTGIYVGLAAADDPATAGAELGAFHYLTHSVEGRAGFKGLLGTGDSDVFGGIDTGLRLQAPSRLAPFVGVGAFFGGNGKGEPATDDHLDNDNDGRIDEYGEEDGGGHLFASLYPEAGAHFWLNGNTRLTASAQYHLTTTGRDHDFWFLGFSIGILRGK